jgi:hypothetical protein
MSATPFASPARKFEEWPAKATKRPSEVIDGATELEFPWAPPVATLTRSVTPPSMSRTNTSGAELVSPPTRFVAELWKATKRPSAEMKASKLRKFPCTPAVLTLKRVVVAWVAAAPEASATSAEQVRKAESSLMGTFRSENAPIHASWPSRRPGDRLASRFAPSLDESTRRRGPISGQHPGSACSAPRHASTRIVRPKTNRASRSMQLAHASSAPRRQRRVAIRTQFTA